jgi:hypothetical protein
VSGQASWAAKLTPDTPGVKQSKIPSSANILKSLAMRFPDRFQATSPEAKVNTSFRQLTIKFLFENNCLDHSSQDKTQQHSEHPKH